MSVYLKSDLTRGVISLEEDNLVAFYYVSTSEIWPDEKDSLIKRGNTVLSYFVFSKRK